jgi:hypothetical protein
MIYGFTFTSIILKRIVFGLIRRQERPDVSRDNSFAYDLLYGTGYCKHESVPRDGTAGRCEIRGNPEIHQSASPMDKKVRGDSDIPHRHSRKMQYLGMPGEASEADLAALSFGDTRS